MIYGNRTMSQRMNMNAHYSHLSIFVQLITQLMPTFNHTFLLINDTPLPVPKQQNNTLDNTKQAQRRAAAKTGHFYTLDV